MAAGLDPAGRAAETEGEGSVVGLGIRSEDTKSVSHAAPASIRVHWEPALSYPCPDVSIKGTRACAEDAHSQRRDLSR